MTDEPKKKHAGAPLLYSEELAEAILEGVRSGLSLRKVCEQDGMPSRSTVMRWYELHPDFETRCARARTEQADFMDDLILDTAMASTPETAHSDKVKISAFQWRASKLQPKKYGDKTDVTLTASVTLGNLKSDERKQVLEAIDAELAARSGGTDTGGETE